MSGFYWLASYPKSGNTWLRLALNSYRNGGMEADFSRRLEFAPAASSRRRFDDLLGVASSDLLPEEILAFRPRMYQMQAQAAREPIFNKVHDAWQSTPTGEPLFPADVTLGSIYVVRDPRDVVLSLAGHVGMDLDRTIDFLLDGTATLCQQRGWLLEQLPQFLGSWSDHVKSWLDLPAPWEPLLVRYEDMLARPVESLARIVEHCGWDVELGRLERTVEVTRFDRLQAAEATHGFTERPLRATKFFREGRAGGWRERLTDVQRRRVEEATAGMRQRLGYS
ncbi:sulfotransferase domain-containing protein [Aquipseudomonas alcaligenes]|uniref:Sulfotransferase domain-containing protein n=1 Tax=Aquipseudomonas alcaligenes TaxID=43263 RepID=A0AB73HX25_AQUAC|nr:sulfotransferase domain-containing protein [Pseudomonas alcaligenes]MDH0142211.1 sulfotransferase domain-containing protein [Pseudomonas alcaligenes]